MPKAKVRADCRADTRGGAWAGIPLCVINSAAYRRLSLHARAILVEVTGRMNGWNNGSIAISQREIGDALATSNFRAIGRAVAELMEHGLLDVTAEGKWKQRQAREYRLTFVTTKAKPATNDYLKWSPAQKSGVDDMSAATPSRADASSAGPPIAADDVSAKIARYQRKTAVSPNPAADDVSSLISKPYPPAQLEGEQGVNDSTESPYSAAAPRFDSVTADRLAIEVREQLDQLSRRQGLSGLNALARAAGADPSRVRAFIEYRDLLTAPTIARLNREIGRTA